jgi:hypothetical protein
MSTITMSKTSADQVGANAQAGHRLEGKPLLNGLVEIEVNDEVLAALKKIDNDSDEASPS